MSVGPDEYREGLSHFTSGVSVITVASDTEKHGMTATAFSAVSLDPPLISVSLERSSRTLEFLREVRLLAVNLLTTDQRDVARTFATKGEKPFDLIPHRAGDNNAPLLDGCLAWIECAVTDFAYGGDHEVVVAEVTRIELGDGEPLVYYRRDYRTLEGL